MPWTGHTRTALVLFSVGLVLTTCLVGAWLWFDLRRTIDVRARTRSSLVVWQQVYLSLRDLEAGARGFVISGDDSYLKPFNEASLRLPRLLVEATALEAKLERGLSNRRIEAIQEQVHGFLAAKQEIITVAQREGGERAADLIKEGKAKARMDELRKVLDAHFRELDSRLRDQDADMQAALYLGGRALLAMVLAARVASAAAGALLRQALLQARRNERLALEKQQSDRANREKSVFVATISHEIRTPMNAILGFGELLLTDARDAKQRGYAGSIVRSGQALLQLINDILDFSKIEAGMVEIASDPVDVRELAEFARQLFGHQCAKKGWSWKSKSRTGSRHPFSWMPHGSARSSSTWSAMR
ncbi:MAG: histidine kinase dimerization/phospho-acceptor domain-containing protein [Verrucomicrobiales bacterium]